MEEIAHTCTEETTESRRLKNLACDLYEETCKRYGRKDELILTFMAALLTRNRIAMLDFDVDCAGVVIDMYRFFGVDVTIRPGNKPDQLVAVNENPAHDCLTSGHGIYIKNYSNPEERLVRLSDEPMPCMATVDDIFGLEELIRLVPICEGGEQYAAAFVAGTAGCMHAEQLKLGVEQEACKLCARFLPEETTCYPVVTLAEGATEAIVELAVACAFIGGEPEATKDHIAIAAHWIAALHLISEHNPFEKEDMPLEQKAWFAAELILRHAEQVHPPCGDSKAISA